VIREAAESLVARASAVGRQGRVLSAEDRHRLTAALPEYPSWLLDLLSSVPLCGLELGWQAFDPEPGFDGLGWVEVTDADGILWETLEAHPGLALLPAGYVNFGGDSCGGGDPYFVSVHEGADPPLYQVYHDAGSDTETILAQGRRLVAQRLSDFFRAALVDGT
jgi:hypothetical protein